jgi:hypothetical protein
MNRNKKPTDNNLPGFNGPETAVRDFLRSCSVCPTIFDADEHRVRMTLRFASHKISTEEELRHPVRLARFIRKELNAPRLGDKILDFVARYLP